MPFASLAPMRGPWIVWGSELSPFTLKLLLLCRASGLPHRFLPTEGSFAEVIRTQIRRARLVRGALPLTWPRLTELDELPLVPFLFGPDGENLYDSSAIGAWLQEQALLPGRRPIFLPPDPATAFVVRLLDEYADELGLYMAHHNRWKVSAADNDAGARLAQEFRAQGGPLHPLTGPLLAEWFSRRQVSRLPYLFSVAPAGFRVPGVAPARQPPSREGFPPTHALLEESFARLLGCLEPLLRERPYLLGGGPTLADASLHGELAMNLADPSAARWIERDAPAVYAWLRRHYAPRGNVDEGRAAASELEGWPSFASGRYGKKSDGATPATRLDEAIAPLLAEVCRVFVPLMQQNLAAYRAARERREVVFNETAFDRGRALYDGRLDGHPFRAVVKAFQAKVWLALRAEWDALALSERDRVSALLPSQHGLAHDT
ncbi:MAG: hypothetical protein FJ144_01410 [Deltaproteobacteria bacterium]|nr:hypothetical protein [Deltaproteobacteria bacterium]